MGIGSRGDGGGLPTVDVGGVASRIFGKPNAKGAASCLCLVPALHHFFTARCNIFDALSSPY